MSDLSMSINLPHADISVLKCNWCGHRQNVDWVLGVYLCEFCRVDWLRTGRSGIKENTEP
jgi:hypothetical protein